MRKTYYLAAFAIPFFLYAASATAGDPLNPPVQVQIWGGMPFKQATVIWSAAAAILIFIGCYIWSRGISKDNPGRGQMLLEGIIKAFDGLTHDGFGTKRRGRVYLPLLVTLFMFIWTSNMMGILPVSSFHIGGDKFTDFNGNGIYDPGEPVAGEVKKLTGGQYELAQQGLYGVNPGLFIPDPEEPTSNVSTTLAMALLFVLIIGHGSAIRYNGIGGYLKDYASPGGLIGFIMMPLNIVGKAAEIISISFRLFGNIFGGSVIIAVVSGLMAYLVFPVFLYGFFGVFVGTVQAFVFTMLALTYISSGAAEEVEEEEDGAAAVS